MLDQTTNRCRTLFVSGLKNAVSKDTICRYFPGCVKVTIKQYRTTSDLKYIYDILFSIVVLKNFLLRYAFVFHRTSQEAGRNLRRIIDFGVLGEKCRVEYANINSAPSSNQHILDRKKVVVSGIPQDVSKNDLRHLFVNCHILHYCPARDIQKATVTTITHKKMKTLWGYDNLV